MWKGQGIHSFLWVGDRTSREIEGPESRECLGLASHVESVKQEAQSAPHPGMVSLQWSRPGSKVISAEGQTPSFLLFPRGVGRIHLSRALRKAWKIGVNWSTCGGLMFRVREGRLQNTHHREHGIGLYVGDVNTSVDV